VIEAILFDLDKTLYPADVGLQEQGDERITSFLCDRLGLDRPQADALRLRLWRRYGTTARGLQVEYGVPQQELYAYAIDALQPADFLAPDPALADMLTRLPQRLYVLTNSTLRYARKVLDVLGITACFEDIFDIQWLGWIGKPHATAYTKPLAALGLRPYQVLFIDDAPHNIASARRLGIITVLVAHKGEADFVIHSVMELPRVLDRLRR